MHPSRLASLVGLSVLPVIAGAQNPNIRVQVPGVESVVLLDSIAIRHKVAGPADRMLKVIDEVFTEFDLPAEAFDPQSGRFPNRRVNRTRRLGKVPLSRYLDCGRSFAGNNADVYRVTISAGAWPDPATGEATTLHVAIIGGGLDPVTSRGGYVLCTSRGRFEQEFAERVREKMAASP